MATTDNPNDSDGDAQARTLQQENIAEITLMVEAVNGLYSVETLSEPVREESIEEARTILRWLRNMEAVDRTVEEWLDHGTAVVVRSKKDSAQKLVLIFALQLQQMLRRQPDRARDPVIRNAMSATAALALELAEHARAQMEDTARIDALIDSLPADAELRAGQSTLRLIETIELGMDRLAGKEIPPERLAEMGQNIRMDAQALRSAEAMQPPAREESLELAREILRRLQGQSFGDKTVKEFIETGRPDEKAAFAQQVVELAETYRNLLSEAAILNPNIHQDARIKEANDAVGSFAHAISLMAAKEMPNSIAAAQQISAEASRDPEQWQQLHHRTVDRLIKSAEGGVEKAMEDIAQQQEEEQDREEEQAQEAVESAMLHSDNSKRKKKRRRSGGSQRSGKGGKKQRKQALDITADDYVLKQGRFAEEAKTVRTAAMPTMAGLDAAALAAIRELGRHIGSAQNVSLNDKIRPDNKSAAEAAVEREKQKRNNPTPRV